MVLHKERYLNQFYLFNLALYNITGCLSVSVYLCLPKDLAKPIWFSLTMVLGRFITIMAEGTNPLPTKKNYPRKSPLPKNNTFKKSKIETKCRNTLHILKEKKLTLKIST